MNFTTPVSITKSVHCVDFSSEIITIGSCFAVNMGERLDYFKFKNTTNPFGIIFNPVSIEKLIVRTINQKKYT
ncbi:MAG TPA: GSCFA domain-containing protein, partial [Flavobacterium sp.]|nr:GSCFA domain-containing protein [Flavobacterium sp.]